MFVPVCCHKRGWSSRQNDQNFKSNVSYVNVICHMDHTEEFRTFGMTFESVSSN